MPAITLISVVLPQPLGPTSIINSPARTSRSIPRSAVTAALPAPYVLVTPRQCTATFVAACLLSYSMVIAALMCVRVQSSLEHDRRLELDHLVNAQYR